MNEEKAREAYEFLMSKYPTAPSINPEIIKHKIRFKFGLNEKEVYAAYYGWKRKVTEIIDKPKFKDVVNSDIKPKDSFIWSQNINKLKELHERYKDGEESEELAKEISVSKENLLNAFTRYKRRGILHGKRKVKKNHVIINGIKFSNEEIREVVLKINNGKGVKELAKELKVNESRLSNAYRYYKNKFIKQ